MSFDHPGLLYEGLDDYLATTTKFVRGAVEAGDAVMVAVPGPNLAALRDALSDVADAVDFADMTVAGRNPGRIIPGVLLAFAAAHAGRRVSIIGEPIWAGRSAVEYPACAQHEALINTVFAGRDAAILCPYDAAGLDAATVRDAWQTHPVMIADGSRRDSPSYADPLRTAARFNQPLPVPPAGAAREWYAEAIDLGRIRRFVAGCADRLGLPEARADDLVIVANELAENTILHTTGGGAVTVWAEGDTVICQVDDHGHLTDPLAGRLPAPADPEGGRGLLLAHHLCDLVRIHTTAAGTTIRLHLSR
jgi:anti-sigma regulatory factor (Ser/Thr protein kinase)